MLRTPVGLAVAGIVLGGVVLGVYAVAKVIDQVMEATGCIGRTK